MADKRKKKRGSHLHKPEVEDGPKSPKPIPDKKRRRVKISRDTGPSRSTNAQITDPVAQEPIAPQIKIAAAVALVIGCVWAYWPTWAHLIHVWETVPDYSHGWLVIPISALILYVRRDSMPKMWEGIAWTGMLLIVTSVVLRWISGVLYVEAFDGYTIVLWAAGCVWLLCGWKMFYWALPSILFLLMMIPWPFRAERLFSHGLQTVATKMSTWSLQFLGQPAIAEGHTILLGEHQLEVEQACSGLRIFISIIALCFAYVVISRSAWWEKLILVLCIAPIALVANTTRIVVTGLLYQMASTEWGAKFSHDLSGYLMVPFAAGLFWLVLWYLSKLFPEVRLGDELQDAISEPESTLEGAPS